MKVDYISDLHLDYNLKIKKLNEEKPYIDFIKKLNPKNETIIIAGDIADTLEYVTNFFKVLKKYFYKNVIYVLGNHEYYVPRQDFITSLEKVEMLKEKCKELGVLLLDGDTVEIDGIKFAGAMGWYDAQYILTQYETNKEEILDDWEYMSIDATWIRPKIDIFDFFEEEKKKIEKVYKDCEVMITHINPSIKDEYFSEQYKYQYTNAFYSFNGEKYLKEGNMKYWLFGHTHDEIEYEQHGVKCLCNPYGIDSMDFKIDERLIKEIEV